jgi:uncharacterized protein
VTLLLALLTFCSFAAGTIAGFGSVVLTLAFGVMLGAEVNTMLRWLVPLNLGFYFWLAVSGRRSLDWAVLRRLVWPMLPGLVLGLVASVWLQPLVLKHLFGVFVLAVGVWQVVQVLRRLEPRLLPWPVRTALLAFAGVVSGIFASGGPLVVFVAARELPDKHAFRATLNALWFALTVLTLPRFVLAGAFSPESLSMVGLMVVPVVAGVLVGQRLHAAMSVRVFRLVLSVLLVVAAVPLLR